MKEIDGVYYSKKQIGNLGEDIAVRYLETKGFRVIARNYLKKWGEIDIVAREKSGLVHFIEVKSVTRESIDDKKREMSMHDPLENIYKHKIERLRRVIQTYILEKHIQDWVFDVMAVYIDIKNRESAVKFVQDIVL